jgi:hypothetical protein
MNTDSSQESGSICVELPSGARARVRRSIKPETLAALDEMATAIMDRDGCITQAWDERGNKIELEQHNPQRISERTNK